MSLTKILANARGRLQEARELKHIPMLRRSMGEPIGFLDADRMKDIPDKYQCRHEFIIYLHYQIQELVLHAQENAIRGFSYTLKDSPDFDQSAFEEDPIAYAFKNSSDAKRPVLNDVALALSADFLKFTHAAWAAFEKRHFAVGYANLRKPFGENLLLLGWICANEDEFFDGFLNDPSKDLNHINKEKREEIIRGAFLNVPHPIPFDYETIESLIYDKSSSHSLARFSNMAMHLTTSHNTLRTEEINLNFIFKSPADNDVYETGYLSICLIFLYAYSVILNICMRMDTVSSGDRSWLDLVLWSSFQVIFLEQEPEIFRGLKELGFEIRCSRCNSIHEVETSDVPRFLIIETFQCKDCGKRQRFQNQMIRDLLDQSEGESRN